ncbi:Uncharacterized protein PECH_003842 [Penicillium ucsense]|uniref:Inositol polyphosphate-related phosphatase domain-containing protein n=1 Tax=Penicillium ucsense TaxID=2839758 RepID=A0A8J8WK77_9EURO|nr:Uncharacterized protein PECM_005609 [Penicillium ucsense]KAF7737391.1 Uncharacterized protein PECH_003842 [Penicillium ucsense]
MEELNIYIVTSNCARNIIDVNLFAAHLFDVLPASSTAPDLIVLSLQELAPIAYSFLGGSYLQPYFDAFVKLVKQATAKRWNEYYTNMVKDHIGMTALLVFARADIANRLIDVDTAHVGFGFQEMGNKGAIGAHLKYASAGQPSLTADLTFVAAHLAPMENGLLQRNRDWQSIVERLVFTHGQDSPQDPSKNGHTADERTSLLRDNDHSTPEGPEKSPHNLFAPNAYLFLAGDLNYRTSNISPLKDDHARFPKRGATPESPYHYSHLLKDDQLMQEMREGRTLHGLTEAPINFPPTYKFSNAAQQAARQALENGDSEAEWLWSTHRWPSWCDRILYLDDAAKVRRAGDGLEVLTIKPAVYDALPLLPHSDHRPVALSVSVPLRRLATPANRDSTTDGPSVSSSTQTAGPFQIDPQWRSRRDAARRKEIVVGVLAYLGMTWEGNGMVLASFAGLIGAWMVLRSL